MEPLAIPCLALASVSCSVGGFYLLLYLKTREAKEHLPFSLLCFNLAAYDLFCAGLYNSRSLGEGVFWQRLQLISLSPISILFLWFYALMTGRRLTRAIGVLGAVFAGLVLATLAFDAPGITLSTSSPAIKTIRFGGRTLTTYYAELNRSLEQRVREALADVKVLRGLIPICAACKKVRNDQGYWSQIETYVSQNSDASFTHGMCPACADQYFPNRRKKVSEEGG